MPQISRSRNAKSQTPKYEAPCVRLGWTAPATKNMPDKMSPKTGMLNAPATSTRSTSSASVRFSRLHRQPRCKYPCTNPQQTKLNQKNGKPNYAVATPHTSATATPWRSHQNLGVCAPGKLSAKKSSSTAGCLSHRHASGPAA